MSELDLQLVRDREPQVERLERSLRLLIACNRALARAKQEQDLLQTVCQLTIELGGYRLAWVGYVQHDEGKTVRPISCAGQGTDYLNNIQITWADTTQGQGPAGKAIRSRQPYVSQDLQTDPNFLPWQSAAQQQGHRSAISLPLIDDEVFGVLTIYAAEIDVFQADEVQLLTELANDLSYGIKALRTESDRQAAQQALEFQVKFDLLVTNISSRFIQLSAQEMTGGIDWALQQIGEFMQVDSSYIFRYADGQPIHSMTHEWVAAGIIPSLQNCQNLPLDMFPWATALLQRGEMVYISSLDNLPPAAATDRHSFQQFGIKSGLTIPLCTQDRITGLVGFAEFNRELLWSEDKIRLLKVFANILENALQRQQAEAELQAIERSLRKSHQKYHNLVDRIPVGVYKFCMKANGEQQFEYVSPRWCEMNQLDAAAVLGDPALAFEQVHPEDLDEFLRLNEQAKIHLNRFKWEGRMVIAGEVRWVHIESSPTIRSNGEIVWDGIEYDITEAKRDEVVRKQAEADRLQAQQVHHELKLLENILDIILAGYWDWDIPNHQEYLSLGLKRMFGYEDAELPNVPETWQQLIVAEDLPGVLDCFDRHVQSHGQIPFYNEVRYRHKTGATVWVICSGRVIDWDAQGNPLRMIGCHVDITNRKQAEAQLRQTNAELARATRLKDEFLATMSHELRTPLNAILGMSEGLLEEVFGSINQQQQHCLETIERSGYHLLELINDILDVAKIEAGQIELNCTSIDLLPLCQSSLAFVNQQALKKQIQIATKLPSDLPDLFADERRIRQVLINLLSNAVKFTPAGGHITLEVKCPHNSDADAPPPNYLRIAIVDTGIGIAPEHIHKIFQPFIQIDSALNRQYQGTGLGLALVKSIVELHGGEVGVTSEVGVGSCFSIDLPCHQ